MRQKNHILGHNASACRISALIFHQNDLIHCKKQPRNIASDLRQSSATTLARLTKLHMPGVEPGSQAWGACMMPLHYMCSCQSPRICSRISTTLGAKPLAITTKMSK